MFKPIQSTIKSCCFWFCDRQWMVEVLEDATSDLTPDSAETMVETRDWVDNWRDDDWVKNNEHYLGDDWRNSWSGARLLLQCADLLLHSLQWRSAADTCCSGQCLHLLTPVSPCHHFRLQIWCRLLQIVSQTANQCLQISPGYSNWCSAPTAAFESFSLTLVHFLMFCVWFFTLVVCLLLWK